MTIAVRICLIGVSLLTIIYMMRKIRQSKLQIEYAIFWVIFSVMLLVLSIFPQIAIGMAKFLGIDSPVNLVFIFIIFILLLKMFMMTIELSQMENKLKELIQKIGIKDKKMSEDKEK